MVRDIQLVRYKGLLIAKPLYFKLRMCKALTKWIGLVKQTRFNRNHVIIFWAQPFGEHPPTLTEEEGGILGLRGITRDQWDRGHELWVIPLVGVVDLGRQKVDRHGAIMGYSKSKRKPKVVQPKYSFI